MAKHQIEQSKQSLSGNIDQILERDEKVDVLLLPLLNFFLDVSVVFFFFGVSSCLVAIILMTAFSFNID